MYMSAKSPWLPLCGPGDPPLSALCTKKGAGIHADESVGP